MSDEKIKVFKLAKQYGFKSADFVGVLKKVGFPVTSYQASLDAWDVPIIEERLLKGGLIEASQATAIESPEATEEEGDGWNIVVEPAPETPEVEAEEPIEEEVETPEPVEDEIVAEGEESTPGETEGESKPAEEDEPEPQEAVTDPVAEASTDETPATPATPKDAPEPSLTPKPSGKVKPRPGATRVGKIDLAALGLVKADHAKGRGKVTFTDIRNRETTRRRDQRTRQRDRLKSQKGVEKQVSTVARKGDVVLAPPVTPKTFSTATGIGVSELMGSLMKLGVMVNMNAELDTETIELLSNEFEISVRMKEREDAEDALMAEIESARQAADDSDLQGRPPVITFMGHVDHGKTSLIDAIRQAKVADGEAGGITQHIGAYSVETNSGQSITIIDTPGHEAFTQMRARGAKTTDVAVLVVAADDGVMPQTEEAAAHAREAGIPVVVAMNKVDASGANPEKVKAELANIGLQCEDWGGETGIVETSALRKTGLDDLLERVLLEAEVLEIKAHPHGQAMGIVLEGMVSEGKGKVAHILIQDGTLTPGDVVLCGDAYGKVRRIYDHNGKTVKSAGPSAPVEIIGLSELPTGGQKIFVVRDMKAAKEVAEKRAQLAREQELARTAVAEDEFLEHIDAANRDQIRLIVKADVGGSLEVLKSALARMSNEKVAVEVIHSGVGAVTETDVMLAKTAEALVVAFNIAPDAKARRTAERERVELMRCNVIYDLTEAIEEMILGKIGPEFEEQVTGSAEVLALFKSSRWGSVAGCSVNDGVFRNSSHAHVIRDGKTIFSGKLASLRHLKDDVKEVKAGMECGLRVEEFDGVEVGDTVQAYDLIEIAPQLDLSEKDEESSVG
ncbi:MAG TPA: translation initiation factor IF-2 [Planctomycetota bacterium]|nr:translation initiation factor IF-2 [Planctomycetota bacterium]HJM40158.1 translation initiation factor IF-2 [Planctomycetota bacterium]